jgi:cell division septum initiation protein DivIVA
MSDSDRVKRIQAHKRRIEANVERDLSQLDEAHKKLDTRGYSSQSGQALLDLVYVKLTQYMADVADLKGQLLDMQIGSEDHEKAPAKRNSRADRIVRVKQAAALRKEHPEMSQVELADSFGCSDSCMSSMLREAREMEGETCPTEP